MLPRRELYEDILEDDRQSDIPLQVVGQDVRTDSRMLGAPSGTSHRLC